MSKQGVDISKWQKGIKLRDLKNAGYEFAILRGAYTGYGKERDKNKDICFDEFYNQAKECELPIGVYYYSCANTKQGGIDEANFLYENGLKGRKFEYPIYIDVEDVHWQLDNKKNVTDAIIGFCETLENKQYFVGVYASLSWFKSRIETSRLEAYTKWVAAWRDEKPYFTWNAFDLWQKSNATPFGKYSIDVDVGYKDFPMIIKRAGLNGYKESSESVNKELIYEVKKGDTLWGIAKKFLGAGSRYNEIKTLNGLETDLIFPGQKLKIHA